MATSWREELVKRLNQAFTSRMQSFSRAVNRGETFSAATVKKAAKLRDAIRKLAVDLDRYGMEERAASKVKAGVYDETIKRMKRQDGSQPPTRPSKKVKQSIQERKRAQRKKEELFILLPCPECGTAPTPANNKKIKCSNPKCILNEIDFTVVNWNKEIRAPWLSPGSFRPLTKTVPVGATLLKVETLVSPGTKIVRPKKQDPELDIEWALRVKAIGIDDDDE